MNPPAAAPIAALGRRSAAYVLDSLIIGLVSVLVATLFDAAFGPLVEVTPDGLALVVVAVQPIRVAVELAATLAVDALYFAGCWSRWGATPAQRALRLRVRLANGARSTHGSMQALPVEAAGRRWAVLSVLPIATSSLAASGALDASLLVIANGTWFLALLVSAAVDPLRRGLHDRVAGTLVVRVPAVAA